MNKDLLIWLHNRYHRRRLIIKRLAVWAQQHSPPKRVDLIVLDDITT